MINFYSFKKIKMENCAGRVALVVGASAGIGAVISKGENSKV